MTLFESFVPRSASQVLKKKKQSMAAAAVTETPSSSSRASPAPSTNTTNGATGSDGEDEDGLEYDLWEGLVSLSTDAPQPAAEQGVAKAIKNAKNQQRVLDRFTSTDIDTMINDFERDATGAGGNGASSGRRTLFDLESAEKRLLLQRQLSSFECSARLAAKNATPPDYVLCWQQQQQSLNEELTEEVQTLQEQVGHLAESQATSNENYSRVKQENAALSSKVCMLESSIMDMELRNSQRLADEERQWRDKLARVEREKQRDAESYNERLELLEKERATALEQVQQLKASVDRLKLEKRNTEDALNETEENLTVLKEENEKLEKSFKREQERLANEVEQRDLIIQDLSTRVQELEQCQAKSFVLPENYVPEEDGPLSNSSHVEELMTLLKDYKAQLKNALKDNEDLKGQVLNKGIEEGNKLLQQNLNNSIDSEIKNMKEPEDGQPDDDAGKIRTALKDQQDVNAQLRNYIDGILMNIIEKYPELLEVRK